MKPLYTLNSIDLLVKYALNYAIGTNNFSIECRAEEGFKVTFLNNEKDFFQVVNTNSSAKVFLQPTLCVQTEFSYDEVDNNIYAFKDSFDSWIRSLYEKERSLRNIKANA